MRIPVIIVLSVSAVFAGSAYAGEELDKAAVQFSIPAGNLAQQQKTILTDMADIEYQEMSNDDRKIVREQMQAIVDGTLTGAAAIAAQDEINELLNEGFADSKLVCTRHKETGSVRITRNCMTVAAKKRQHEHTQKQLNTGKLPSSAGGGGG